MTWQEQLFTLYNNFYAQRSVLVKAPLLTISMENKTLEDFDIPTATKEIDKLVSYLLGVPDVTKISPLKLLDRIEKSYKTQPFWEKLLLDYIAIWITKQKEILNKEKEKLLKETKELIQETEQIYAAQNKVIKRVLEKMAPFNFAINGQKLMENFFKMLFKNPIKAFDTLRTNPAFFSPILQESGDGKKKLSPAETKKENERIANFFKNYDFQ